METAREGVSFAASAWERYAAELFSGGAELAAAREEMLAWTEEELQKRYAAYLAGQFFLAQAANMRAAARESVRDANLALLYEHDGPGNVRIDENSGDPVIRYGPDSLDADLLAWREKAGEGGAGIFAGLYPELAAYFEENGLGETALRETARYAEAVRRGLRSEFSRELAREEALFTAKRTLDVYSLRNRSDSGAAGVISRELILETEYIVAQGLAALEERINALDSGAADLSLDGREWLGEYRAQFERGLRAWEDAEERFFVRRIEWEQEAGVRYEEGETAWAEAFYALQAEQWKWAAKAEELFQAGEQLFANAEAELKEAVRQAKTEYERDAQERREAGTARAGAYFEMYITSGTVVSAAAENLRFWAESIGKKEYPPVGSAEFDAWVKNGIAGELAALENEYSRMDSEQYIPVPAAAGGWPVRGAGNGDAESSGDSPGDSAAAGRSRKENPEYLAEAARRDRVLEAWAELKPAAAGSAAAQAALKELYKTVIEGNGLDENRAFAEETIRRMDGYHEIELWSDLFKTYTEKAKEARTGLLNDFDLVIGKDAGGLADVLNGAFSSEDFFLDEYQVELIRAEAVKNYWAKRQGIAEAVARYANLATGDRTTAGDLAADWEKARAGYNTALEEYRKAQTALEREGAEIAAAREALGLASDALNEANAKLGELYAEYGELMAAYVSDGSSFFAYEFSSAYQALIENTKTVRATGADAVYADYLEHAARYCDEAALDRESLLLKEIVTDGTKWAGDRKDFALGLLAASSLEEWYYGTLEREPPVDGPEDAEGRSIRERLERERDEKKEKVSLEKIKMIQKEEYDGGLVAELGAVIAVLETMIEVMDYTGDASGAVRNDNGERAVNNIRRLYAEYGLEMNGYLLPSPRGTAQSLLYAEGDVIQNIAGFLSALDREFAALPDFLFNEAQSWKGAFIEYLAAKMKDAGIQAAINEAEIENAINAGLEKTREAEKTNQVFVEHNRESARYLCAVIGLGTVFPPFSADGLKREAAKRIAAELVALCTDAERQDAAVIKEHLGAFRQENYGYADDTVWEAALGRAAEKIIERENIQSFDGVASYGRENTLTGYEREAVDSRVFLEESGLVENGSSFYAAVPLLADAVIEAIAAAEAMKTVAADPGSADPGSAESDPEPAEPDFTGVKEYLSAWKDGYGALFVVPARVLAYTLAERMESAADLEKVLAALELDVCESAETIREKALQDGFDLMDSVLHFAGNGQTAGAIAGPVILARLKFFAYEQNGEKFAREMELAEGDPAVPGAVLEAARQFKDTVDKGARYYGYEISGDLFAWALKTQDGNVEKAVALADFVAFGNWGDAFILSYAGREGGQQDYFSAALREAVSGHIETLKEEINTGQNMLDLAAARNAVVGEIENLVRNGKEHWRYYISETVTDGNGIFAKYNDGIAEEEDKLKPGGTGIPDEP
ncbi:MAG: hypothetical protein LBL31_03550, partial [Spirochaetaceae bacterium]|nr:hypothetical protein [Spirochaetaceae bacterium]